jgi:pilus assembly protein FimV
VVVHADEVDPIAEADVYLAYGRDQQAEEVLIDGMTKFPDRDDIKLKLLTIYRKRKDVSAFETLAEELYPTGSDASQDTWELVARMGRKISPDNPLFSESAMPADEAGPLFNETPGTITGAPAEQDEASIVPEVEEEADSGAIEYGAVDDGDPDIKANLDIDLSSEQVQEEITLGGDGDTLDSLEFDLNEDSVVAEGADKDIDPDPGVADGAGEELELDSVADQVTAVMNSLDFDDDSEKVVDEDASSSVDGPDADQNIEEESVDPGSGDTRVALETGVPVGHGSERSEVIEFTPELTARREQRNGRGQGGSRAAASPSASNETKSEFETQIELAKVFIELGDKDGARKILSEVLTDGESDHRRMAEELMSAMNE